MTKMKQLVKLEGFGNVQMLEADIPAARPGRSGGGGEAEPDKPGLGAIQAVCGRGGPTA